MNERKRKESKRHQQKDPQRSQIKDEHKTIHNGGDDLGHFLLCASFLSAFIERGRRRWWFFGMKSKIK